MSGSSTVVAKEMNEVPWYSIMAAKVPLPLEGSDTDENEEGTLFVGSLSAAECLQFIKECKITHILTVAHGLDVNIPKIMSSSDDDSCNNDGIPEPTTEHLVVACHDHPMANILEVLPRCLSFIHKGLRSSSDVNTERGRVLVHCASGVSRSVTVCAAYIMMMAHSLQQNVRASDAIASIASTRRYANPNLGFRRQLAVLERHIANAGVGKEGGTEKAHDQATSSLQRFVAIVNSAEIAYKKLQSNVVEDTIRQRTVVNELHVKVDVLEERLATMKSRNSNNENDNSRKQLIESEMLGAEYKEIEKTLLLLQEDLDASLPTESEGLVDPAARMIRKAAMSKIRRLLDAVPA